MTLLSTEQNMATDHRLTIAVFGESDTLTPAIRSAWSEASMVLQGPYSSTAVDEHDWHFGCAVIDVRYGPERMLLLMEALDSKAIPYIFFVPLCAVGHHQGPFVLSGAKDEIRHIVSALAAQGRGATH
ncbi:hypothetical protein [Agrobacterium larrymoorei]|uniref:Uncharacterized protein n=1 Tax=Agrobacterium larrymoorei TaxID=160699 RepID=A0ABU0UGE3_9HYPH|nr:hypothetical protein [Agrobacterium larrymoorei]MDQ1183989.1 hypothetical protein [Agrobacterium larrymoorei]